ncbi:MAG: hypothetical protein WBB18_02315, partial [Nodosilinea sp.]
MLKLLLGILGTVAVVYCLLCGWLWVGQRRLMYFPGSAIDVTPSAFGLDYSDVWIPLATGRERLHGWWLPADKGSEPTILYFHGNAGNVSSNLGKAIQLRSLGVSVLAVDYRG